MKAVGHAASDSPGVIAWPPAIYLGALLLGLLLHFLWPVNPLPPGLARVAGAILILAGCILGFWAERTMHRAGTNIRPDRPATALVTWGPFRFTRNPLYVSVTGVYLGLTLLVNALGPLLVLPFLLALLQWGVIHREECYLEGKFGETYRAYRARVRRWL
jgi:protein-S-isoprenylcysteine O-methyltransferase Ste14